MKLPIVPPEYPSDSPASREAARDDLVKDQLHELLTAFYDTVERDALLSPYFHAVDMNAHMPRIVAFWETVVFDAGSYTGNAFRPHLDMAGLTAAHFTQWLATLERTVDERASGPFADRMKGMAHRIAYSMQLRLGISPERPWSGTSRADD